MPVTSMLSMVPGRFYMQQAEASYPAAICAAVS